MITCVGWQRWSKHWPLYGVVPPLPKEHTVQWEHKSMKVVIPLLSTNPHAHLGTLITSIKPLVQGSSYSIGDWSYTTIQTLRVLHAKDQFQSLPVNQHRNWETEDDYRKGRKKIQETDMGKAAGQYHASNECIFSVSYKNKQLKV